MHRVCLFLIGLWLLPCAAAAQRDGTPVALPADSARLSVPDSLSAPVAPLFSLAAPGFEGCAPWSAPYGGTWRLHEGFNAQFSLGLTVGLGRHAPRGAGFSRSAAFVYAVPLTQRLSVAAGVYAGRMDWGALRQTEVGAAALVAYRVSPAVSLYGYVAKSFYPRREGCGGPFPLFLPAGGDRIGAVAEFKLGDRAAIQVGVECASEPGGAYGGFEAPFRSAGPGMDRRTGFPR